MTKTTLLTAAMLAAAMALPAAAQTINIRATANSNEADED